MSSHSFGALNSCPSSRDVVHEQAVVHWYKLLWHTLHEQGPPPPSPHCAILEPMLEKFLHNHLRSDMHIVACIFRVWALARCFNEKIVPGNTDVSVSVLVNFEYTESDQDPTLSALKNNIALLVAGPVHATLIPPHYRQTSSFQCDAPNKFDITHAGLLALYSAWHLAKLDALWMDAPTPHEEDCSQDSTNSQDDPEPLFFNDNELRRLNAINGCTYIPAHSLYCCASEENVYVRIKNSTLDTDAQALAAAELFDYNPAHYANSLIGAYLNLSRTSGLPLLFADEVLFYQGAAIWLQFDATRRMVALVHNQVVSMYCSADYPIRLQRAVQEWTHTPLEARSAPL